MKLYTKINVFEFDWTQVTFALMQKYPNPYSKHVLNSDIIHRELDGHSLYSVRLLLKKGLIPQWGRHVLENKIICILIALASGFE